MADNSPPFAPATLSSLLQSPSADLQRELQERQKKLLAASQAGVAGLQPGKLANMLGPMGGMGVTPL